MDVEAAESVAAAESNNSYRDFSVAVKLADVKAVSADLVVAAADVVADAKVVAVVLAPDVKDSDSKSKLTTTILEKASPSIRLAFLFCLEWKNFFAVSEFDISDSFDCCSIQALVDIGWR